MKRTFVLNLIIFLFLQLSMDLGAVTSLSLSQRVGDYQKMSEADLVSSIRNALDKKIAETIEQKKCQSVGKKWSLAFPRLEKMSPNQLDEELKDLRLDESSRGCLTDEKDIIALLKGLIIAKKNDLSIAQEKLSILFEGESALTPTE